jgi:hypothetical protein
MTYLSRFSDVEKTHKKDPDLLESIEAINSAAAVAAPLAGSPSQNVPKRTEVAVLLSKAKDKLTAFSKKVQAVGWDAQVSAIATVIQSISSLHAMVPSKKDASWDAINSKLKVLQGALSKARRSVADKAESESMSLTGAVDVKVEAFSPPEKLDEASWKTITQITDEMVETDKTTAEFPLTPLQPWSPKDSLKESGDSLEKKVAKSSGPLANNVEKMTRMVGLRPHSGRKIAAKAVEHKIFVFAVVALLVYLLVIRQ